MILVGYPDGIAGESDIDRRSGQRQTGKLRPCLRVQPEQPAVFEIAHPKGFLRHKERHRQTGDVDRIDCLVGDRVDPRELVATLQPER